MRSRRESFALVHQPPALVRRPQLVNRSQLARRRIQLDAVPNAPSAVHQGRVFQIHIQLFGVEIARVSYKQHEWAKKHTACKCVH
jgi:hypothetical protein